jgi:hypothetical protein
LSRSIELTTQAESLAKYPHAREAGSLSQSQNVTEDLVPPTPEDQAGSTGSIDEITESLVPALDISTEYDADMSASFDKTQEASISEIRPEVGLAGIESSPAASTSGTEVSSQADEIAAEEPFADVFGSLTKPSSKRKGRKRSSARHSSKASRSRSSTAELDVKPSIVTGSYDETEIVAARPQKPVRLGSKALYELQLPQTRDAAGKASFIASASKWMSRLPTLGGLFSPSRPTFDGDDNDDIEEEEEQDQEQSPAVVGRKRKIPHQLGRSHSQPELGATTRTTRADKRQTPLSRSSSQTRSSKRSKMNHIQADSVIVIMDSDEEDELILSPETAKQRKAEEERASREYMAGSPHIGTQHSTGRFDGKSHFIFQMLLLQIPEPSQ